MAQGCCGRGDAVTQVVVRGMKVGLVGLEECLEQVRRLGPLAPDRLAAELLRCVESKNYVAAAAREDYAWALVEEFERRYGAPQRAPAGAGGPASGRPAAPGPAGPPGSSRGTPGAGAKEVKTMEIKVLGPGCARCHTLQQRTMDALAELDVAADVEMITDRQRFLDYGVLATPGLVVNGKLKMYGRVPTKEEIKGWIREEA
ncbi:MAG: thioredoxin family protein [Acetobacteraceae bacterium]|nr:thioredoxin family protein [Acetobacteraceae bacterium]